MSICCCYTVFASFRYLLSLSRPDRFSFSLHNNYNGIYESEWLSLSEWLRCNVMHKLNAKWIKREFECWRIMSFVFLSLNNEKKNISYSVLPSLPLSLTLSPIFSLHSLQSCTICAIMHMNTFDWNRDTQTHTHGHCPIIIIINTNTRWWCAQFMCIYGDCVWMCCSSAHSIVSHKRKLR